MEETITDHTLPGSPVPLAIKVVSVASVVNKMAISPGGQFPRAIAGQLRAITGQIRQLLGNY